MNFFILQRHNPLSQTRKHFAQRKVLFFFEFESIKKYIVALTSRRREIKTKPIFVEYSLNTLLYCCTISGFKSIKAISISLQAFVQNAITYKRIAMFFFIVLECSKEKILF